MQAMERLSISAELPTMLTHLTIMPVDKVSPSQERIAQLNLLYESRFAMVDLRARNMVNYISLFLDFWSMFLPIVQRSVKGSIKHLTINKCKSR